MDRYRSGTLGWATGLCLVLACNGCATIAGGSRDQKVALDSKPQGAQVFVDGRPAGTTPTEVAMNRNLGHEVVIEKAGYQQYRTNINPGINPWLFGNLAVGGLIGLAVDIGCESCHQLTPGTVEPNLVPVSYQSDAAPMAH